MEQETLWCACDICRLLFAVARMCRHDDTHGTCTRRYTQHMSVVYTHSTCTTRYTWHMYKPRQTYSTQDTHTRRCTPWRLQKAAQSFWRDAPRLVKILSLHLPLCVHTREYGSLGKPIPQTLTLRVDVITLRHYTPTLHTRPYVSL